MTTSLARRHGCPPARGSAAVEAAIGVPAFALFVGLIICGGRTATTHQALESAAADAARSASIARDQTTATSDARDAATTSIKNQQIHCRDISVDIAADAFHKQPGQAGAVRVTVRCRLDLSDLSVPGVPGSRVLTASVSSPVDTWRERS